MRPRDAQFVISAAAASDFPPADLPEIAFVGRSNVGKSSLINALVGHGSLARTSRTPGRTRLVNWFRVVPERGNAVNFVDLPGYGYAAVSRDLRAAWQPLIESYLSNRPTLALILLLVDLRRGPEDEERDFVAWLADKQLPVRMVLTKSDKLAKNKREPTARAARAALPAAGAPIVFSTEAQLGHDAVWRAITTAAAAVSGGQA